MYKLSKFGLSLVCLLIASVQAQEYLAQKPANIYDPETSTLRIFKLVLNESVYEYVDFKLNEEGMLDVIDAVVSFEPSTIPSDATFVFMDSETVIIPVIEVLGKYYYNLELSILSSGKLAITTYETESSELLFREGESRVIDSAIVVSSNLSSVRYPDSFQMVLPLPIELIAPQCNLTPSSIVFPADWMGELDLPVIKGAPFGDGPELIISLKDFWQKGNPSFNQACAGNVRENFRSLVKRAKSLNAARIEITPWTFIDDRTSLWKILSTEELIALTNASVPTDEDIIWMTQVAHENGLKMQWRNQIQGNLNSQIPIETIGNMEKFVPAYEEFMLERADFLNGIGVDAMQFDCICWFAWYNENEVTSLYYNLLETLVLEIDSRFDGELYNEHQNWYLDRNNIVNTTDEITINLSLRFGLSAQEKILLEPSIIKAKTLQTIDAAFGEYSQEVLDRVTVVFEINSPSRFNFFEEQRSIEETFCTSEPDTISQNGSDCIQRSERADFASQARVVEGVLEALKVQTKVPNFRVSTTGYWITQPVLDGTTFPNIAYSVRGKPSEKILQIWFDR